MARLFESTVCTSSSPIVMFAVNPAPKSVGRPNYLPLEREAHGCAVLKLSSQSYYRLLAAPNAELVAAFRVTTLFEARADGPEFGYLYLADEANTSGQSMAVCTVWRL